MELPNSKINRYNSRPMPLVHKARRIMRINLERIRDGQKPKLITIGFLTPTQRTAVNSAREASELPPIVEEVVFLGNHIYKSRIIEDGYTIEDVLDQIHSAMDETSVVVESLKMTGMENPNLRADRYGNQVLDRAVLECSVRHPRPELFSVIPKGDHIKPNEKRPPEPQMASILQNSRNERSPGNR